MRRLVDNNPEAVTVSLEGSSASAGQTTLALSHGGIATDEVGMPVAVDMEAVGVAVSWLTDSTMAPGDYWTLTLQKRAADAPAFEDVATFDFFVD